MHYVIIGNSAAGIGAAEAIRKADTSGKITIISDEPYHTYSRPLISYFILGKINEQKMKYRNDDFYDTLNITTLFGKQVIKINNQLKQVILNDESFLTYDKLLLATGSKPFIPEMNGLGNVKNKFTFMTLDDAKNIQKNINRNSKVLIIGAGLIGLKCAEGISNTVKCITVVDLSSRILSSILDEYGANIVKKHIEKHNVKFFLNTSVETFYESKAILANGVQVDFDIVVLAVGVSPSTSLFKEIGGEVNRGIVTDKHLETSISDIYAAGDCTESFDITSNKNKVLALLPNAYMQGECAGFNMAGIEKEYNKAIPMNAIGFWGLHIITAGSYDGEIHEKIDNNYKRLFIKDGLLNGYILIGSVEKAGIYTNLIRDRIPVDEIDFDLVFNDPGLMAFSKEVRKQKLGGSQ